MRHNFPMPQAMKMPDPNGKSSAQKRGRTSVISKCGVQKTSRAPRCIVKDDSRTYTVFSEQGSSASQMTAEKEMDGQGRSIQDLWSDGKTPYERRF